VETADVVHPAGETGGGSAGDGTAGRPRPVLRGGAVNTASAIPAGRGLAHPRRAAGAPFPANAPAVGPSALLHPPSRAGAPAALGVGSGPHPRSGVGSRACDPAVGTARTGPGEPRRVSGDHR